MVRLIHFLLSQWELPAAPAGPGWDDSVQSRKAWRREGQPQKDLVHQKSEGEQRLTGVLPPGCDWKPHYLPVITEESSDVLYRCVAPCARLVSVGSSILSELAMTLEQLMGQAENDGWVSVLTSTILLLKASKSLSHCHIKVHPHSGIVMEEELKISTPFFGRMMTCFARLAWYTTI